MQKSGVLGSVLILSMTILFLSVSFVSASWYSDAFGKITGNAISGNGDCSYRFNGALHTGTNNSVGLDGVYDPRFLCLNNKFYECGWEGSMPLLVGESTNGQIVGSYKCDLTNKKWNINPPLCIFSYSNWSSCSSSGKQTRTATKTNEPCQAGYMGELERSCDLPEADYLCTDSDGGLNYYIKGNATWGSSSIAPDVCFNSIRLDEAVCHSDGIGGTSSYDCPNGCSDGRCLYENETTSSNQTNLSTCTDSDGGVNYYVNGNISINGTRTTFDYCGLPYPDGWLVETYCLANQSQVGERGGLGFNETTFICPNGCSDGACINSWTKARPESSCSNTYALRFGNISTGSATLQQDITYCAYEGGCHSELGTTSSISVVVSPNNSYKMGDLDIFIEKIVPPINSSYTGGEVYFSVGNNSVINYAYTYDWSNDGPDYLLVNSTKMIYNNTRLRAQWDGSTIYMDSFVVSSCTSQVCKSLIDSVENPEDILNLRKEGLELESNQSNGEYYFAGYSYGDLSFSLYAVEKSSDTEITEFLDSQLCSELKTGFDLNSTIYSCISSYDVARSGESSFGYNGLFVVDKGELFILIEQKSSQDYSYYDEDYYFQQTVLRNQDLLVNTLESLVDNRANAIGVNNQYFDILNIFFTNCEIESFTGYGYSNWICKTEPVICPPHGEQTQICTLGEEVKERTLSCSPGMCSGCYVPRWFESAGDNVCMPYGTRFEYQIGWKTETTSNSYSDQDKLSVKDALNSQGELVLEVYQNKSALLTLEISQGNFTQVYLEQGNSYNWGDIAHLPEGYSAKLHVDEISYNAVNYNESYILVTFSEYKQYNQVVPDTFNAYCNYDGNVFAQKATDSLTGTWAKCQNNYECASNVCSNGECVDTKALAEDLAGFKGFVVKMLCTLTNIGNSDGYNKCVADNA